MRLLRLLPWFLALALPALAAEEEAHQGTHATTAAGYTPEPVIPKEMEGKPPFPLSLILHPRKNGMLISLPMMDTDPNRGVTFGFLPVWIINSEKENRIIYMHAPSVTFNPTFKTNFTWRSYYYPTKDSALMVRGAIQQVLEREFFLQYDNSNLYGINGEFGVKTQYNVDASNRFFGFGPASQKTGASNYVQNTMITQVYYGLPFYTGSNWYWTAEGRIQGVKIADGPVKTVPSITVLYPESVPAHYHQSTAWRGYITYDTTDNSVTTSKGTYAEFYAETSQRQAASEYTFQRYSADLRHYFRNTGDESFITAVRFKLEQVLGPSGTPLWLLPYLGGKYIFPAYGDGRFTDRGLMTAQLEERIAMFRIKAGGVAMRFEAAPFTGLGTIFDTAIHAQKKYARPLFGLGVRAIAPPQVVGSIDFGFGQEGLSTFMDINYPF